MSGKYSYTESCLAVTGMACRFPGASTLEEYWQLLCSGTQAMQHLPLDELQKGVHSEVCERDDYVPVFAGLDDVSLFAADRFGYSPAEAEIMDPQHRLLLETAWQALENSCDVAGDNEIRRTGVYTSCNLSSYLLNNLYARALVGEVDFLEASVGNNLDFLATRIAYKLDFRGPALAVQSACSSSLAALHIAAQALLAGECDRAVVGAATITVPTRLGYFYLPGGMRSPDGRCRPYDTEALGTVFGNGVGAVVLKRLQDAMEDGDPIWAVVRGSAVNNDGSVKIGFTAPSQDAQAAVIAEAMRMAGVSPGDIGFIEGHGTATPLGDPIEVAALLQAFRSVEATTLLPKDATVLLGSVKSNIGHLDCTAGIAGFIKAALSLHHGVFPGTANFTTRNPHFGEDISPFRVTAANTVLASSPGDRLAGVSSFGFGGTNVHIVLQGAERSVAQDGQRQCGIPLLYPLSAPNEELLNVLQGQLARELEANALTPDNLSYSLALGRRHDSTRKILRTQVDFSSKSLPAHTPEYVNRDVAFLFPGQGAQFPAMFKNECEADPRFQKIFETTAHIVAEAGGPDAMGLLQKSWAGEPEAEELLKQTRIIQPVLFALEFSAATRLMEMGVTPSYLMGHSLGEYVAACLAGVFSVADCCKLLVARGEIMQKAPAGKMLAALLPREQLPQALGDLYERVEIAVCNSRENCVLCGPETLLEDCRTALASAGGVGIFLRTSHAFHSSAMDHVVDEFLNVAGQLSLSAPRLPLISNVTGTWAGAEMSTPEYWARHLRSPVLFDKGITTLFSRPVVGLEIGPGQVLSSLVRQELGRQAVSLSPFTGMAENSEVHSGLTRAVADLWLNGADIHWQAYFGGKGQVRLHLPNTPLLRKRYWVETTLPTAASHNGVSVATGGHEKDGGKCDEHDSVGVVQESRSLHPRPDSLEYSPPETGLEKTLVGLWEATLHMAPIGIHDPFIELGGNSLHVLRMIRMAHEQRITLSIKDVFDGGTVAGICSLLAQRDEGDTSPSTAEVRVEPEIIHANEQDMQTLMDMLQTGPAA